MKAEGIDVEFTMVEDTRTNKEGFCAYYVRIDKNIKIDKDFSYLPKITEVSKEWVKEFFLELVEWDGYKSNDRDSLYFSTTNPLVKDKIIEYASVGGIKLKTQISEDNRKESYKDSYRITFWLNKDYIDTQNLKKEIYDYDGEVYCFTMPEGTLVTKYDDQVQITGNCHMALTQNVLNTLRKNEEEGFKEIFEEITPQIYDMYFEASEEEFEWIDYLYQKGCPLGINQNIAKDYIKYLTNLRLKAIGLKSIYPGNNKNPITWINKWLNMGSTEGALQEIENIDYQTGAIQMEDVDYKKIMESV
jgi:ribonucleotide reductase beta subunit family protein with ferritin-like domain